jgi:hypothetical protein
MRVLYGAIMVYVAVGGVHDAAVPRRIPPANRQRHLEQRETCFNWALLYLECVPEIDLSSCIQK